MRFWLAFMIILSFAYEGDEGPSGSLRRYQNVVIAPYHQTEGTTVYFEFKNTLVDSITLSFRISNQLYQSALVYSQAFPPLGLIQRAITLPASLFDGGLTTLQLSAIRTGFSLHEFVTLYPLQQLTVAVLEGDYQSPPTVTRIDGEGQIRYEREQLAFIGMDLVQSFYEYGRLDLSHMRVDIQSPVARELIFGDAYLLIADHPAFEGLPYQSPGFRKLPLSPRLVGTMVHFQFQQLYVHPQTFQSSTIPLTGYQVTQYLYFPPAAFLLLRQQSMYMQLTMRHFHQLTIQYPFTYEGMQPLLGACYQSVYCVNVYA
jgi:hypothetical protein